MTPTKKTLDKYGLSLKEWQAILDSQGGVCPICGKAPSTGRWVIDHYHVKGWKNMPPEIRKLYTRGILCWFCNHSYVGRGITIQKAENMVLYLKRFAYKLMELES